MNVHNKSDEETLSPSKNCIDRKYFEQASEVKIFVLSLQDNPNGISPYFNVVRHPQINNESNDLVNVVMKDFRVSSKQLGNFVLLNHSTYGVKY